MRDPRLGRTMLAGCVVGLVVAIALRTWVVGLFLIPSLSMAPTLVVGDVVWVDRLAYRTHPPRPGDVVVFRHVGTDGSEQTLIKRVIATSGERVTFDGRHLQVEGRDVERRLIGDVALSRHGEEQLPSSLFRDLERWEESFAGRTWRVVESRTALASRPVTVPVPPGRIYVVGDHRTASIDSRSDAFGMVPLENVEGRARGIVVSYAKGRGLRKGRIFQPIP